MIHLNQAGTSWPKPEPVRAAAAAALTDPPETWGTRFGQDQDTVCRHLGVGDRSRLLLTPGATTALSVGVLDHPWEPGDRILVSSLEHHALYRPTRILARHGVEVVVLPRSTTEPIALEAYRAELARPGTRLVAITAASNVTGELTPVPEIVQLAREAGVMTLIDAAQTAGWMSLDLDACGADLVAFAGHKGPQAPWGIGGLYVAPQATLSSPMASCSVSGAGDANACVTLPGYCDVGSVDRAALAGLAAGLDWLDRPERTERLARARQQIARIAQAVTPLPGVELHGPTRPETRMPTLAMTVAGYPSLRLAEELGGRGILAAGGFQCAPLAHETLGTDEHGVLRLSAGPATEDSDVDTAIGAITEILATRG